MVWIKPSSGDGLGVQTIATSGGGFTLRYDQTNSTIYTQVSRIYTLIPVSTKRFIIFIQCWTNVEDVGPTLYKCYTNVCAYWDLDHFKRVVERLTHSPVADPE